MGIILLPFLLGAIVIGLLSLIKSIKLIRLKEITVKELILGLIVSLILFGLITLIYYIEGQAWALSPAFRIPIFMIFLPFGIHLLFQKNKNLNLVFLSKILLVSISFTLILGIIFNNLLFNLIEYIGIRSYY
ncbi:MULTISPECIES: hypothetical protein [unclassified Tenacibaculum]|uniref:hypothetical protein n=1 Tax=unclassified Tenacibaculum TaxID=2635139 RepID=UPI001F28D474|nr:MULTISPECIES: hypothetical protein [unclassified Tenacibaculum]MCF2874409.1 hypothetical protein [Tenacibaculum sp. Cn5-1]MCF2934990.1 hypothetical protein [Tenacibaculum sp. Cn5-34]MCG7511200.1 hypothetical protein [Tenacibaculum sp. Cn5-46]